MLLETAALCQFDLAKLLPSDTTQIYCILSKAHKLFLQIYACCACVSIYKYDVLGINYLFTVFCAQNGTTHIMHFSRNQGQRRGKKCESKICKLDFLKEQRFHLLECRQCVFTEHLPYAGASLRCLDRKSSPYPHVAYIRLGKPDGKRK